MSPLSRMCVQFKTHPSKVVIFSHVSKTFVIRRDTKSPFAPKIYIPFQLF